MLSAGAQSSAARARRRGQRAPQTGQSASEVSCIAASYARYSSDDQRAESIPDQQRKCKELAERNGHRILPEFEYADAAVSGTKRHRKGLDALLRDAEAGEFQVLYFHSLSRLARESVITMPLLKQLVYVYKVRVISVTEGIDSARDGWEVIATIMALLHERYVKELGENVFRGQEGAVLAGLCVGDYRFGYKSVPIPGSEANRRGRNPRPHKTYVIDEEEVAWVIRVFHWFVVERRALRWIVRELNRRGAPKDHRSTKPHWHHSLVAGLLSSEKYIGIWPWGKSKNVRDPMTGQVRQEPRAEEESAKWTRHFPHLQVIEKELFDRAQELLEANFDKYAAQRCENGRLNWKGRGSADCPPRHLLQGLISCTQEECKLRWTTSGSGAKYLRCPGYTKGTCTCQTQLRRDRAERMILAEIGKRILANELWFDEVFRQLQTAWQNQEAQLPGQLVAKASELTDLDLKIGRLVDAVEQGAADPDVNKRLEERRAERRELQKDLDSLQNARDAQRKAPTKEWLQEQLQSLHVVLQDPSPAAAYALRDLVGGEIKVTEIRLPDRQRHFLRGEFIIRGSSIVKALSNSGSDDSKTDSSLEEYSERIVIDFVDPDPLDAAADEAKALYDQDLLEVEIAAEMGCSKANVTKLLRHWFRSRGLKMPDGRTRRSMLKRKHQQPPDYQQLVGDVMKFFSEHMKLGDIAKRLKRSRDFITKVVRFYHESHGLPVPDGRTRRKTLPRKGENQANP